MSKLDITSFSTARISTWHYISNYNLLFDVGDGVAMALHDKMPSIKHIFLSHGDPDHISSLVRVCELIPKHTPPFIYYPADCERIKELMNFAIKFSKKPIRKYWIPIRDGDTISLNNNTVVKCFRNNHIKGNKDLSFSFKIYDVRKKLKSEYIGKTGIELVQIKKEFGADSITNTIYTGLLGYSGDCKMNINHWKDVPRLIHECTYLTRDVENSHHLHTYLDELYSLYNNSNIQNVIISHLSSRYSNFTIDKYIRKNKKCNLYKIYPNKICKYEI